VSALPPKLLDEVCYALPDPLNEQRYLIEDNNKLRVLNRCKLFPTHIHLYADTSKHRDDGIELVLFAQLRLNGNRRQPPPLRLLAWLRGYRVDNHNLRVA